MTMLPRFTSVVSRCSLPREECCSSKKEVRISRIWEIISLSLLVWEALTYRDSDRFWAEELKGSLLLGYWDLKLKMPGPSLHSSELESSLRELQSSICIASRVKSWLLPGRFWRALACFGLISGAWYSKLPSLCSVTVRSYSSEVSLCWPCWSASCSGCGRNLGWKLLWYLELFTNPS